MLSEKFYEDSESTSFIRDFDYEKTKLHTKLRRLKIE